MDDRKTGIDAANEHWDTFLKGAVLLGSLHGAGLLYCITALKEIASLPPLLTPREFIWLFGIGFVGAVVFYIMSSLMKVELQQALFSGESEFTKWLKPVGVISIACAQGQLIAQGYGASLSLMRKLPSPVLTGGVFGSSPSSNVTGRPVMLGGSVRALVRRRPRLADWGTCINGARLWQTAAEVCGTTVVVDFGCDVLG
jgi:hypothetical protein